MTARRGVVWGLVRPLVVPPHPHQRGGHPYPHPPTGVPENRGWVGEDGVGICDTSPRSLPKPPPPENQGVAVPVPHF